MNALGCCQNVVRAASRGAARAFTMIEMVVVVLIITVLITLALPAFNGLITANGQAQAVEAVRAGLTLARAAAVNGNGQDAAAVFFFEPGGSVQVVACVRVGEIDDNDVRGGTATPVTREVFAPLPGASVISLPRGFTVRAYVPPERMAKQTTTDDPYPGWYSSETSRRYGLTANRGDWVFPETGFYRRNLGTSGSLASDDDGLDRSTFMVRYEAGSGRPVVSKPAPVIVLAPRPSPSGRGADPWATHRLDRAESLPAAFAAIVADGGLTTGDRQLLVGTSSNGQRSSDTVMAGPVLELALVDEGRLASALGLRPDAFTGVLYRISTNAAVLDNPQERFTIGTTASSDLGPNFVAPPAGMDEADFASLVSLWIEGYKLRAAGQLLSPSAIRANPVPSDDPPARIFSVDRSSGAMVEVPGAIPENVQ